MNVFDHLTSVAACCADTVLQATGELAQKGRLQAQLLKLENRLSRAQRQLGALVYTLRKTGTENEALVARYVDAIAELETQIAALRAEEDGVPEEDAAYCPQCGAPVEADALFCPACGGSL